MENHSQPSAKNAQSEQPIRKPRDSEPLIPLTETAAKMEPIRRSTFDALLDRAAHSRAVQPSTGNFAVETQIETPC